MGTATTNQLAMTIRDALASMRKGHKVRLPEWRGYWFMEKSGLVKAMTKDGDIADAWTSEYQSRTDFEVATGCDFGWAITALKAGKLVTRKGWNGKGMFVFIRPEDDLDVETIVHKVKSLPQSIKDWYAKKTNPNKRAEEGSMDGSTTVRFTGYFCMKNAQGEIMNGWAATQTDILAEDWELFES